MGVLYGDLWSVALDHLLSLGTLEDLEGQPQ